MSKECGILFDIRERSVGRCLPITFNSSRADGEGRGRTDQKKKKNKQSICIRCCPLAASTHRHYTWTIFSPLRETSE